MFGDNDPFNFAEKLKSIGQKQPTIKDIADHFKEVVVKRPCCQHTIKFKIKV